MLGSQLGCCFCSTQGKGGRHAEEEEHDREAESGKCEGDDEGHREAEAFQAKQKLQRVERRLVGQVHEGVESGEQERKRTMRMRPHSSPVLAFDAKNEYLLRSDDPMMSLGQLFRKHSCILGCCESDCLGLGHQSISCSQHKASPVDAAVGETVSNVHIDALHCHRHRGNRNQARDRLSSGYELTKKLRTTKKLRVRMKRRIEPKKKPRAMTKQTAGMKRAELGKKLRTLQQKRRMTVWKKAAKRTVQRELRKDEEEQALHVDFGSSELWEGLLSKTEEYPWDVCSRDEAVAEVSRKRKERKKKRTRGRGR